MKTLKFSLTQAAAEFGQSKETVARALRAMDIETGRGKTFTIRQCHRALAGDLKFERARRERAEADRAERENRLAEAEILEWEVVEQFLMQHFINPMITAMDAAPKDVDRDWVEKVLKPLLRQKLTPPKQEKRS